MAAFTSEEADAIRAKGEAIGDKARQNPDFASRLKGDPVSVLSEEGLDSRAIPEFIRDLGPSTPGGDQAAADCALSCCCSKSC